MVNRSVLPVLFLFASSMPKMRGVSVRLDFFPIFFLILIYTVFESLLSRLGRRFSSSQALHRRIVTGSAGADCALSLRRP
jgi:hypothetical protein